MVFTTGPFAPLTWEEAADALETALAPVARRREGARHPVRDRAHELAAGRRRLRAHAEGRDRPRPPVRRRRVHGAQRVLGRARARSRRSAPAIDRIRLVQVSDFKVGTVASSQRLVPGDGDIPIERILDVRARRGVRGRVRPRADRRRDRRRGLRRGGAARGRPPRRAAHRASAPDDVRRAGPTPRRAGAGRVGISRPSISATRAK